MINEGSEKVLLLAVLSNTVYLRSYPENLRLDMVQPKTSTGRARAPLRRSVDRVQYVGCGYRTLQARLWAYC